MWKGGTPWPTVVTVVMVAVAASPRVAECSVSAATFQHRAVLDQRGDFIMMWTPTDDSITVEIQVATKGWVGLGFSPNGGMRGADITLGWVDSHGKLNVHDRYAHGTTTPVVDHSQDVVVEGGYENDTHTVIRFWRPWNTCDTKHDLKLSGDTMRVIWAYGEEDPINEMTMEQHIERGTKSIYLMEPGFTPLALSEDINTWDIRAPNVSLPSHTDTLYWCKLFKMPDFQSKTHLIGFEPLISKENLAYVHHIALYACTGPAFHLDKWTQHDGLQCYSPNMPPSWSSCSGIFIVWAVGNEGELWPEHVGIPIGDESGITYFLVEMHYDNPRLTEGILDDSGLRLYYTRKLRQYDAGLMQLGHSVNHRMIIPPGQTWKTVGHCSPPCTEAGLPAEGVKVFQGFLHAHTLARGLTLRHIRGYEELPSPLQDLSYDFNYQQARKLQTELTVLPGDSFIVECHYDAKERTVPTFGGESTREEMCQAFLMYYPRVDMVHCSSYPTLENIYQPLGVKKVDAANETMRLPVRNIFDEKREKELAETFLERKEMSNIDDVDYGAAFKDMVIHEPASLRMKTLYDILYDSKTWRDGRTVKELQQRLEYETHRAECDVREAGDIMDHKYEYPHFITIKTLDEECPEDHEFEQVYLPVLPETETQDYRSLAQRPAVTLSFLLGSLALLVLVLQ